MKRLLNFKQKLAKIGGMSLLTCLLFCASPWTLSAQTSALSAADRQALLYAPQLSFARNGEPIIRLGLDEDQASYTFTPSTSIFVLPSGKGGPRIQLPKDKAYQVTIHNGKAGSYVHSVTVERIPTSQQSSVEEAQKRWKSRGFVPMLAEVGGLFSISGNVFDSRLILLNVGKTASYKEALATKRKLEQRYGVIAAIHSELSKMPDGEIEISSKDLNIQIFSEKVISVVGADPGKETVFTLLELENKRLGGSGGKKVVGELVFAPSRQGRLVAMVNTPAERVLKGTVPAETFANAPEAALQAQAIAARNNLMSAIGIRNLADPYMLRTDVMDQVYGGIGVEQPSTNRAVDATRGEVMMSDKRIINAVYSSNAAGYSVNNDDAWDMTPVPWLRGKPDLRRHDRKNDPFFKALQEQRPPTDQEVRQFLDQKEDGWAAHAPVGSSRNYRWRTTVGYKEVLQNLKKQGVHIGNLRGITIDARGASGRVKKLTLRGTHGNYTVERELNIRRLFGNLKSSLFVVTPLYGHGAHGKVITAFVFTGGGFGHGVGMCQTGAIARAAAGQDVKTILSHYYTDVAIQQLYR